ncbi:protein argonaute-2 [Caerostris extrusa]|uniref:Protein argonaute-2 n=1 Tax=Caerostris extrusa TaxID=172846 RepID=A0AAV4NCZ0_CAEEX|nr:protein argonaute-2 [Caerostris extrusa]
MYPLGQPPGPVGPPARATQPITPVASALPPTGAPSMQPPPGGAQPPPDLPTFVCPRRPNLGTEGRPILLRANHFEIRMPRGYLHHYDVTITPTSVLEKLTEKSLKQWCSLIQRSFQI